MRGNYVREILQTECYSSIRYYILEVVGLLIGCLNNHVNTRHWTLRLAQRNQHEKHHRHIMMVVLGVRVPVHNTPLGPAVVSLVWNHSATFFS